MLSKIKNHLNEHGYIFIAGHRPDINTAKLAHLIGKPIAPWEGKLIQRLVPRVSAPPNTYSGIYGLNEFPLHTDLAHWRKPPRYFILRCKTGSPNVNTFILDGRKLIEHLGEDFFKRAIFKPRRPLRSSGLGLLRPYWPIEGNYCIRWDSIFLKPASKLGELAFQKIETFLKKCDPVSLTLSDPGDMIIVDNWRMLHGRSSIPAECHHRVIERIYLESLH